MNPQSIAFSIGSISVRLFDDPLVAYDQRKHAGYSALTAGFELNVAAEANRTMGGYSQFPTSARLTRVPGDVKMTLRECPLWLEEICKGSKSSVVDPSTSVVITPSGVQSGLTVAVSTNADNPFRKGANGSLVVTNRNNKFEIDYLSSQGRVSMTNQMGDFTSELEIDGTGLKITGDTSALSNNGDQASWEFTTPHGGGSIHEVRSFDVNRDYHSLRVFTGIGGPEDALWEYTLNKILFSGFAEKATDNADSSGEGIEISAVLLDPGPSSVVYTKRRLSV